ncbi:MAG: virulence factor [Caldilineales bacterium]|nr:virulence factor [Caldilineales bacterium]
MTTYQILYWHDIPTQVRARAGRERASSPLPDRFMEAVDAAAMAARLSGTDAYMAGFHWAEPLEREGAPAEVAAAVAAELAAQFESIPWRELAARLKAAA